MSRIEEKLEVDQRNVQMTVQLAKIKEILSLQRERSTKQLKSNRLPTSFLFRAFGFSCSLEDSEEKGASEGVEL